MDRLSRRGTPNAADRRPRSHKAWRCRMQASLHGPRPCAAHAPIISGNRRARSRGAAAARMQRLHPAAAAAATTSTTTLAAMDAAPAVVFSTPGCPYCKRAKATLAAQRIGYSEVDVSGDAELRAALADATGSRTVPQVYVRGQLVGGSDDLEAALSSGRLAHLMAPDTPAAPLPPALQGAVDAAPAPGAPAAPAAAAPGASAYLQALAAGLPTLDDFPSPHPATTTTSSSSSSSSALGPAAAGPPPVAPAFSGAALVDHLVAAEAASSTRATPGAAPPSRQEAAALAARLLAAAVITPLAPPGSSGATAPFQDSRDAKYRRRRDAPRSVPYGEPLNAHFTWRAPARPAQVVAEDLRRSVLALYDSHLAPDGSGVRYGALAADPGFWQYMDATAELQAVDLSGLGREALMCFAINTYNALVIHALVVHGAQQLASAPSRARFFSKGASYNIGGVAYTCDDLEHGVLRGNRAPPSALGVLLGLAGLARGPFGAADPRANQVVRPLDPRIHFALVCGAKSCPPIKLYSPATLDQDLAAAAEAFCASGVSLDPARGTVTLSKIFRWYGGDFGARQEEVLGALLPFLAPERAALLRGWLQEQQEGGAAGRRVRVEYAEYSWAVNAAD